MADDLALRGITVQFVDRDLRMAEAPGRADPEVVPEAIGDDLDEVDARPERVEHDRDGRVVEQPDQRCSSAHRSSLRLNRPSCTSRTRSKLRSQITSIVPDRHAHPVRPLITSLIRISSICAISAGFNLPGWDTRTVRFTLRADVDLGHAGCRSLGRCHWVSFRAAGRAAIDRCEGIRSAWRPIRVGHSGAGESVMLFGLRQDRTTRITPDLTNPGGCVAPCAMALRVDRRASKGRTPLRPRPPAALRACEAGDHVPELGVSIWMRSTSGWRGSSSLRSRRGDPLNGRTVHLDSDHVLTHDSRRQPDLPRSQRPQPPVLALWRA